MRKTLLLAALPVLALTGCTADEALNCTKKGMDSAVSVVWQPADFERTGGATIRLCANGDCEERASLNPEDPFETLSVRLPDDIGPKKLPVELTVTPAKGGEPLKDTETAQLVKEQPNGPGCEPTVWRAAFRAHPEKGLIPPKGLSLQPSRPAR
ncbi:hypothetical protein GCM10010232_46820 [Streptomyces amakusaensis]|uniref:Lipoprotein n=1 Tax=Streptomyces amakusaensis TaxID=67271 RepID=A0ABW0AHQ2_9ACTN